ncbi:MULTISPECIES: methionyl-tRNA formyltransferase [Acinetobacter]|uniref:Methionyl-tRNA formyltransferase n=2 Tax=Acinetobacter schindleri TaxID=108981 RepID=A0AAE2T0U3_9GAMM|nr:methionyl-tRNA formyltransferase [Acinetobacter schindleri]ENV13412.1 methionyl-tRNA formyltransferase [Acinetobacter schindleri NIPH 900]MBB4835223.1 methionyl-tRNA formyltransferase [Acinetobacter schindleri]MCU4323734.1 methionyl-tRNA formyltransferase [Acinetobacter schindleri]QIC62877.1 methionyl-tRNA formyltransferase [Acinetobacter schindleri]QIC65900.1 methionyl-tRNA formyltransferase [Acinetobacter schindleri]
MKIIFAGTPEFAATALAALLKTDHEIVAVYTQPDRKAGRGQKLTASAVKQLALEHNIPVYQPLHFKSSTDEGLAAQAELKALNADVMVVAAYGLILPQVVLDTPKYGCLNIHGSLLPRWRGAAPIQRAIATGDAETGVTIMKMAAGLDTGDMMYKTICPIEPQDTSASLHDKLAQQGAEATVKVLESEESLQHYLDHREVQDEALTVYAHKLSKAEAKIDWTQDAVTIDRNIRAFNPWPVAFTPIDETNNLRVWGSLLSHENAEGKAPGTILALDKNGVHVACGDQKAICLTSLQWPGGKALNPVQINQTQKLHVGQILA